ncbi:MAG: DoxX family protein [Candidatus Nomurabacteria bacterium]|nr:DoxX family protein [Candidatus Nomurabacteria bacterium]
MKKIHELVHKFNNPNLGILFIRIALGVVFISEGWTKISHIEYVAGFFGVIGIPVFLAYFVSYFEFVAGILLICGVFVRYVGIILSAIMLVAIAKVHFVHGFNVQNGGYEYVYVLLLSAMSLVTFGSGPYSVKKFLNK